jgi:hypothetical protein
MKRIIPNLDSFPLLSPRGEVQPLPVPVYRYLKEEKYSVSSAVEYQVDQSKSTVLVG